MAPGFGKDAKDRKDVQFRMFLLLRSGNLYGINIEKCLLFFWSCLTYFEKMSVLGGVADGGDCIVVTSQPCRSPDGLFEGPVSEYGLCPFLCGVF